MHGDIADVEEVELLRRVPVADLMKAVVSKEPVAFGPLPMTAKFFRFDESNPRERHLLVMSEVAAGIKNLRYVNRRYNLSVPWTYFLSDFRTARDPMTYTGAWGMNGTYVYWSQEQVHSWESPLSRALIANCDRVGLICYGDTGVPVALPLDVRIDRLTSEFYRTTFMHDSGTGVPFQTEGAITWARWEQATEQHGAAAYREFPEWGTPAMPTITVKEAFERIARDERGRQTPVEPVPQPNVQGEIPEIPRPFTFGRAEEWLQQNGITAVDRHRMWTALNNLQADNPAVIEAPPEPVGGADNILTREGGTPIDEATERRVR